MIAITSAASAITEFTNSLHPERSGLGIAGSFDPAQVVCKTWIRWISVASPRAIVVMRVSRLSSTFSCLLVAQV